MFRLVTQVFAQTDQNGSDRVEGLQNPILPWNLGKNTSQDAGTQGFGRLIASLINLFVAFAAILALIYLVLGGLQWITGGGEKAQMEQARNRITHAIIGLVIVAASWSIWILVGNFVGINFNKIPFPTLQ